jgi:hypothetical protein
MRYNKLHGRNSGNFVLNSTSMTKRKEYTQSLVNMFGQVKTIFNDFDIVCTGPTVRQSKDDIKSNCVHLYFSNTRDNLIKYFENIGWRYDHHKYNHSLPVYEYLKYADYKTQQIQTERDMIEKLSQDKTRSQIAKQLYKSYSYISDSLRSIKNNRKPRMKNNCLNVDRWMEIIVIRDKTIFIPVDYIMDKSNVMIADITTKSDNHSFIAGDDFCVHNCSMGKQALGMYAMSYKQRTDTIVHVLDYGQRPLVTTKMAGLMGFDDMPYGMNCIVAILTYTGLTSG